LSVSRPLNGQHTDTDKEEKKKEKKKKKRTEENRREQMQKIFSFSRLRGKLGIK
jgi:ribosomal protein L12E/L44/L45/RPP1/RPP2